MSDIEAKLQVIAFPNGGYRYIKAVFQYSAGVAAEPGFEIVRARFSRPYPIADGFAAIESHLRSIGRPMLALCACELRSAAPFTPAGFTAFNREYVKPLAAFGIYKDEINPVARTNVCPRFGAPQEPSFCAFSYTVPSEGRRGTFVTSGSGETRPAETEQDKRIVSFRDISQDGLRTKVRYVMTEMERRMTALGFGWEHATTTDVYTVHDVHPFFADEILSRGAGTSGLTLHFAQPPVTDIEYEMDVRGVLREHVIA